MNTFILAGAVALVIWLIMRNIMNRDIPAEACAKDVIELLKNDLNTSAKDIAAVYQAHSRTKDDIDKVTTLIKARLTTAHIRKEDQTDVMQRVRQAKSLISD